MTSQSSPGTEATEDREPIPQAGPAPEFDRQPPDADGDQAEREFLRNYNPRGFPPTGVTVDVVLLTVQKSELCVLLIRRGGHPHRGRWALPGGFIVPGEDLDEAAARELAEETGLPLRATHLEQLRSYGRPDRDPRMRIVSVAYLALVPGPPVPAAGSDASDARFWPVAGLATGRAASGAQPALAFDHDQILADAVERARTRLEYTSLAGIFLEEQFTLADLRRIYEAVWGRPLDAADFHRTVLSTPGYVLPAGETRSTERGPAELYVRGPATTLNPAMLRSQL